MKYILFSLILVSTIQLSGQENRPKFKISGFGGYSTYSFLNLEKINSDAINQLPFDVAIIDNFPSRFFWGGYLLAQVVDWYALGVNYQYYSTGSRIGAKDYSGVYSFDQILSTHQFGIENEIKFSNKNKPVLFFSLIGGINFSTWKMEEILHVSETKKDDLNEFEAMKPFVYPAIKISYPIATGIFGYLKGGYLFDLGGNYRLVTNKNMESSQRILWNSLQFSVGIEYAK